MNIVAIMGSPHDMKGNTGRLLEEVLSGAREAGAEVELVSLAASQVGPCVSCDVCHRTGACPVSDAFEAIKARLLASDGFIMASPNYIYSVTAQMKALFDRCCGLVHCCALEGKYGAVVETSGGGEDEEVIRYVERFINSVGAQSVGGIGSSMAGFRAFPNEEALFSKARELGRELCRCIREKQIFPKQIPFRNDVRSRMKRLVGYRQDEWQFEYEWWRNRR